MRHCETAGLHHISGKAMYYPQMYKQWALFLGEAGIATEQEIPDLIKRAEEVA
eukprot:SAG31_NODE_849_length_11529_cov_3.342257_5_plen_53_part_00